MSDSQVEIMHTLEEEILCCVYCVDPEVCGHTNHPYVTVDSYGAGFVLSHHTFGSKPSSIISISLRFPFIPTEGHKPG